MDTTTEPELAIDLDGTVTRAWADELAPEADAAGSGRPRYRRVLLKLSGEVLGAGELGVDPDMIGRFAARWPR